MPTLPLTIQVFAKTKFYFPVHRLQWILTLLPWFRFGVIGDWGDNYFLSFLTQTIGSPILQQLVASNWFRGAVTGLGILNLFIAFWEMAHFRQSVETLKTSEMSERR